MGLTQVFISLSSTPQILGLSFILSTLKMLFLQTIHFNDWRSLQRWFLFYELKVIEVVPGLQPSSRFPHSIKVKCVILYYCRFF